MALIRVAEMEDVKAEALTILRRSGPPLEAGQHWFLVLLQQATANVRRRRAWEARRAS